MDKLWSSGGIGAESCWHRPPSSCHATIDGKMQAPPARSRFIGAGPVPAFHLGPVSASAASRIEVHSQRAMPRTDRACRVSHTTRDVGEPQPGKPPNW